LRERLLAQRGFPALSETKEGVMSFRFRMRPWRLWRRSQQRIRRRCRGRSRGGLYTARPSLGICRKGCEQERGSHDEAQRNQA
jgi:hypothetical protein